MNATEMVVRLIERHEQYGWTVADGEWSYIQSHQRRELHDALDTGDVRKVGSLLANLFRGPLAFGLTSYPENIERDFVIQVTWRLALWCQHTRRRSVDRLDTPNVGNPVVYPLEGVHVMVDTPRFDCYAECIADVLPIGGTVLEIGSGYGGVALQILRWRPDARIVLCDLPETLYLAAYWLSHSTDVAWHASGDRARVTLLPASDLPQWSGPVDLVFSAHSLSGMGRAALDGYMAWLGTSGARYFYHDDVLNPVTGPWLTESFPEIPSAEIVPPGFVEQWRVNRPWAGLGDRFSEFFYERAA